MAYFNSSAELLIILFSILGLYLILLIALLTQDMRGRRQSRKRFHAHGSDTATPHLTGES